MVINPPGDILQGFVITGFCQKKKRHFFGKLKKKTKHEIVTKKHVKAFLIISIL